MHQILKNYRLNYEHTQRTTEKCTVGLLIIVHLFEDII